MSSAGRGLMWVASGKLFDVCDPRPEAVDIRDIAHALARQCRYAGHVSAFYSVAEHSVHVSRYCAPEDALWGLLHDAAEAYLGDVIAPVKRLIAAAWDALERPVQRAVCLRFGLPPDEPTSVREADAVVAATEMRDALRPSCPYLEREPLPRSELWLRYPWERGAAEIVFKRRYEELTGVSSGLWP